MGILICICDEASEEICTLCEKNECTKPSIKANWPHWKRVLKPQIIHYSDKPKVIKG